MGSLPGSFQGIRASLPRLEDVLDLCDKCRDLRPEVGMPLSGFEEAQGPLADLVLCWPCRVPNSSSMPRAASLALLDPDFAGLHRGRSSSRIQAKKSPLTKPAAPPAVKVGVGQRKSNLVKMPRVRNPRCHARVVKQKSNAIKNGLSKAVTKSPPKPEKASAKAANCRSVFQLKISLNDIKPAIWRRVQTKDCTPGQPARHRPGQHGLVQ